LNNQGKSTLMIYKPVRSCGKKIFLL